MEQYTLTQEQVEALMYGYASHVAQYGNTVLSAPDWPSKHGPAPSPAAEKAAEELWDRHSRLIGEDIHTLEEYAGREVMLGGDFIKAIKEFIKKTPCTSPAAEQPHDGDFQGSVFSQPSPGVTLGCISPEARDLLDTIMAAWESHFKGLKETHGDHYDPTFYGFAYWLVRWSGLIQPATAKATPSGITWVRASVKYADGWQLCRLVGEDKQIPLRFAPNLICDFAGKAYSREEVEYLDASTAPSQGREVADYCASNNITPQDLIRAHMDVQQWGEAQEIVRKAADMQKAGIGPVEFAQWIYNEPYLYGRAAYGWFYDIPVEGAGVEHKLIGDTTDLYQLFIKQKQ